MLTYENVMNAPLDKLQTAIRDWGAMVAKLDELAEAARNGMKAKADKAEWSGVTAGVGRAFIDKTAKEFEDAAKEAKGIHLVLTDGHATFKAAQDQIKKLVAEAPAAGFRIDESGRVTAIPLADPKDQYAAQHDPDYQESLRKNRGLWQERVNRAVEDAQDADDSLVRALQANVTDDHNFTTPKYTTLDAEQVDRAAGLMRKVTGEGGTARNPEALRELEDLLDDNRNDPEFATGFYRKVGPEGTLQAYSKMSLDATGLGQPGLDRALMVGNIQSDLGAMLGLATHKDVPNHLDAAWTTELMKAGHKEMDVTGVAGVTTRVFGYQALGALMREGTYDTEFLTSVGRDMVAMDRKDPKAWEYGAPYAMALNQGKDGGRGFYPLTGLMEALGNNPDAATAFFNEPVREDSNHDGIVTKDDKPVGGQHGKAQGMVDYMLDKKPYVDGFDVSKTGGLHPAQQALGDALMSAVSHRTPGDEDGAPVPHTKEMAAVMERVVEKIGDKPELVTGKPGEDDSSPLKGLSGHFGEMAAEYMPDIQASAENGSGMIKANGEMAEFHKADMAAFIGAVGRDPEAYGAISNSQRAFTTTLVNDVIAHRGEYEDVDAAIKSAVHPGGQIAGILSEARAEGTFAENGHKAEEYVKGVEDKAKWINRGISAAGGKYLEMVPMAGDVVEWLQEDITEGVVERAKKDQAEKTGEANHKAVIDYTDAQMEAGKSAAQSVRKAAEGTGMTQRTIDALAGVASTETANAHAVGRGQVVESNRGS
ncbi:MULTISPECIES: DUF6571 family protein [unclassified Streptomyces]|uniref:DUF6571 family protein n=1 Tax=unclassified Streptomyces TaxID=2593676 RepID=UPI001BEACE05|nr:MULTISPECIES: DUF6571 family protein [unclassified Streptomyces]MBT2404645.1 hypothetical protein [Streptomyces sp. ISL-21]MBT2610455.1 hypothetical protein [Streptomyces sp. ISL-87]